MRVILGHDRRCCLVHGGQHNPGDCCGASTRRDRINAIIWSNSFPKIASDLRFAHGSYACAIGRPAGWWRNQVAWRLVYCPVDQHGPASGLGQGDFAAQVARTAPAPRARASAGSAGSRPQRQQSPHLRPPRRAASMAAKRPAMASRSASRGGSSRTARETPGRRRWPAAACQAARPARCRATPPRRARCAGCRGAQPGGGGGVHLGQRVVQPGRSELGEQPACLGAGGFRARVGDGGDAMGQRREIQPGAAAQNRQAARPRAPPPSRRAPRRATRRHLPGSAAARTPYRRCGTRASSAGVGRAVSTRSSR